MADNEGWAIVGKFVAGAGLVGGLVTGGVFGVGAIYNSGYSAGHGTATYKAAEEAREAGKKNAADYKQSLQDLVDAGRLIPEKSCLRARSVDNALGSIYGTDVCEGIAFTVSTDSAEVVYDNSKVSFAKETGGYPDYKSGVNVIVSKKTDEVWNKQREELVLK